jgi:iron complex outermembrane recepter protein
VPILLSQFGNPHFQNEVLLAYEAGYRANISNHFSVDVAMYYNDYDKLRSREFVGIFPEDVPAPPHFVEELTYQNFGNGEAHGMEISANWKVADRWTLSPGVAVEIMHMHAAAPSQDGDEEEELAGLYPSRSAQLRSNIALFHSLTWNATVYFVDRLPAIPLPSYTRLDTSLIWQVSERAAFSIVGQNLVRETHIEFNDRTSVAEPTGIERSAYAKLAWRF